MTFMTDTLPNDLQALKILVSAQRAEISRLKMMIAKLRRTQFDRSCEQIAQMLASLEGVVGALGYECSIEATADPMHPEHDEMVEWCGEVFESAAFDCEWANPWFKKIKVWVTRRGSSDAYSAC
jgi:hypothetical protein